MASSLMAQGSDEDLAVLEDMARADQDHHEMEFSCGLESHVSELKSKCKKNPSHEGFFSVSEFGMQNLPEDYRDKNILDFIKVHSALTVRVVVGHTSMERPKGYPSYKLAGRRVKRYGSGWVMSASKFTAADKQTCPCPECVTSGMPRTDWGHVEVFTATHVVYNSEEAEHVVCDLNYDSEDDSTGRGLMQRLYGWRVWRGTVETDRCHMSCVTHDLELCDRLEELDRRRGELQEMLRDFYWSPRDVHKLTIVVSHPHGCCKQISLGKWTERQEIHGQWTRFTYNTPTCAGCSGAPVYIIGMRLKRGLLHSGHPHSGCEADGLNRSGAGVF